MIIRDPRPDPEELARASRSSLGLIPADLILSRVSLVDVWSLRVVENVDIAIKGRIISCVGRCIRSRGSSTKEIDLHGKYIAPGLIDPHTHIESTYLRPSEFSKAVMARGTTTVFADPHEIANVTGVAGLEYMARELSESLLRVFLLVPPNVPASPRSPDRGGASLEYSEVLKIVDSFSGVGEVMDIGSLLDGVGDYIDYVSRISMRGIVQGHAAGLSGEDLDAYASLGMYNDHEVTGWEEFLEKLSKGLIPIVRYGSSWRDLDRLYRAIERYPQIVSIATDDIHALHIAREGHMDRAVRRAIELGVDPVRAIASATIAPAILYGVHRWIGSIAPGRYADLVVIDSLDRLYIESVYIEGNLVARHYRYVGPDKKPPNPPRDMVDSIRVGDIDRIAPEIPRGCEEAEVRAIRPIHGTTLTREERISIDCRGLVVGDLGGDLSLVAVVNRYGKGSGYVGLAVDIGIEGALASSIAHDSHNIIAVGSSMGDIRMAIASIVESRGGISYVYKGRVEAAVVLEIAGLMSSKGYEDVAEDLERLFRALESSGVEKPEDILQEIQLLSLTVIPEIRITDRGLYHVTRRQIMDLVVSYRKPGIES
jgi:adenine deaminase